MIELRKQVLEVIHNLNWLLEAHDSFIELAGIEEGKVIVRSSGHCTECETDCIGVAFNERLPGIELIRQSI